MMSIPELDTELDKLKHMDITTPLYYDIKGRQLRIEKVIPNSDHLEIILNHSIEVDTPIPVLFKAGEDCALLKEVVDDGKRLIFFGGPKFNVKDGESLHIRDTSLKVFGEQFTKIELEKIEKVKEAGFKHWFLSYVESQTDVDEFVKLVGSDSIINLKIENKKGLKYVENNYKQSKNLRLVAARGDLYVEVDYPHQILQATKTIINADPNAIVGSRLLLSVIHNPVPSCADFNELAWLADIGYNNFMLCDELCLKGDLLKRAINVFDAFRNYYDTIDYISPVGSDDMELQSLISISPL